MPRRSPLLVLLLLAFSPALAVGEGSVEWVTVEGFYDLYPGRVSVEENLLLRYGNETHLLGGQSLSPVPNLSNISFHSSGREIEWEYDGTVLSWSFVPPLANEEEILLNRRWDLDILPGEDDFRTFQVPAPPTEDAVLHFQTHGVDIIDSSLNLDGEGIYRGNLSFEDNYVAYSTTYKLYLYEWYCFVENLGNTSSEVKIAVSLPRDDGFQTVIGETNLTVMVDSLGNREAVLSLTMEPGSASNLTLRSEVLTWTWSPPAIPWESVIGPDEFLFPDDRFWQSQDPSIISFASAVSEASRGDLVRDLSEAVGSLLEYFLTRQRRGALWAFENQRGSCMEHADLYVALARSLGIPSFYVSGFVGSGENGGTGHSWAAAWKPEMGWIGIDPTWPGALQLDSGRLVFRFCNPEDPGVCMESVGGNATISEWGDAWHYREVTPTEVDLLLGIGEASVAAALGSLILLAIISRSLTLADGALFSVEIDAQECPED